MFLQKTLGKHTENDGLRQNTFSIPTISNYPKFFEEIKKIIRK
ncbi:hypothetical protein HMPREF9442_03231 [Paraprevotella xylaniphila YIT 11841]|uniref:Uncharacterized protein n=1 Tax=Paraprevotella xylaniphila YIT 11841 TaxID=762982 RepID=F3QYD7_9BACT|nr:hypothetical protein HMPREF9442_03231 [Paraprevotella xylaniphila YIT 11841]